jgi:prepilin-type N-terminal cleavage/methylation domain-containing protein
MFIKNNKGFTLVELAIVIVIIGLLVGGVMQGQALIEQAKNRKIIADINSYYAAWNTFKAKYNGYAGDLRNAEMFFGTEAVAGGAGTINGNGNNGIEEIETLRTWEQFQLAGMIKGSFTGSGVGKIGTNVPASSYDGVGIEIDFPCEPTAPICPWYGYLNNNIMTFGASDPAGLDTGIDYSAFKPMQVFTIDAKIDDGNPKRGLLIGADGRGSAAEGCVSSSADIYNTGNDTKSCTLTYVIGGW